MEYDTKTLNFIEVVRKLCKECQQTEDLPRAAITSCIDTVLERLHELEQRLWDTRYNQRDRYYMEIEVDRLSKIRADFFNLHNYYRDWVELHPTNVTEKITKENTVFILEGLYQILSNLTNCDPLNEGLEPGQVWLLGDNESKSANEGTEKIPKQCQHGTSKIGDDGPSAHENLSQGIDHVTPEVFVIRLRAEGMSELKQLAAEVDRNFTRPDGSPLLSFAKLGALLPANPGAVVGYDAQKSQGQRLRGKK